MPMGKQTHRVWDCFLSLSMHYKKWDPLAVQSGDRIKPRRQEEALGRKWTITRSLEPSTSGFLPCSGHHRQSETLCVLGKPTTTKHKTCSWVFPPVHLGTGLPDCCQQVCNTIKRSDSVLLKDNMQWNANGCQRLQW